MLNGRSFLRDHHVVGLSVLVLALAWAVYTQHAWEDYYITYRAAKNLATGNGLTFTAGERVHSFTSPLGVLLPALASLLTGNKSDVAALWIFRVMSAGALAAAAAALWIVARRQFSSLAAAGLLVGLLVTESKVVDFSTNGMETAFLLLFLVWSLSLLLHPPQRPGLMLGLAWAGLMWTRPDSFVYIAAMAVGVWIFRPVVPRRSLLRTFGAAGLVTTASYGPWLIWAWQYYSTPVPHTVTAKGLFNPSVDPAFLWEGLKAFPAGLLREIPALPIATFMPAYSSNCGWPGFLDTGYHALAIALCTLWLLPGINGLARLGSFVFCAGQFYLYLFVRFPVPWYLPTLTLFAFLAAVSLLDQAWSWARATRSPVQRAVQTSLGVIAGTLLLTGLAVTVAAGRSLKHQQAIIEVGQRTAIGHWLKSQATTAKEAVFLEPLGYIGFYSGLKMLDFPGLCAPEVVAARRRAQTRASPDCWPEIIEELAPDWLVLRAYEAGKVREISPALLEGTYRLAKIFDVRAEVNALPHLAGRGYLMNDAYFEVYRRKVRPESQAGHEIRGLRRLTTKTLASIESWGQPAYDSGDRIITLPPSRLALKAPRAAAWITGQFGLFEGAYANPGDSTDGAEFRIEAVGTDGARRVLWQRALNPATVPGDRGPHAMSVALPRQLDGAIELVITPGPDNNTAYDWTYWSSLALEIALDDKQP